MPAAPDRIGRAFAGILMIGAPVPGLLLMAAVAIEPLHLVGALLGLLVAEAFLRSIGTVDPALMASVRANAILSAMAASWLVAPMQPPLHVAILLIVVASGAAAILATALARFLAYSAIPPLSAAFTLVFGIALTLLPLWAQAAASRDVYWPYPIGLSGWVDSFLRSMGMILFSPRPATGVLVLAAMLLWSRSMVLCGLIGWICGILTAEVLAAFGFNWLWLLAAHNSFIAGMLLGAVLYLPGRATLVVAALAGIGAAILALAVQTGFGGTGWAFQPLPALVTVWIAILALSARSPWHPVMTSFRRDLPPERAWRQAVLPAARYGRAEPLIAVPLAGTVLIGQSFNGPLSHRGAWSHGLDFELPNDVEAGSIAGARVFCPAAGVVDLIHDGVDDNPIGVSNFSQNWGNHIVIRMDQGWWLMLAHLAKGSLAVVPGQRVVIGQELGRVGNSGRSPVPHLHMHVQHGMLPGSPTLPFKLANYLQGTSGAMASPQWIRAGVPDAGACVRAALSVPASFAIAAELAPGGGLWRVNSTGKLPERFARFSSSEYLSTALDPAGNHCVSDRWGGRLVIRADADGLRAYDLEGAAGPLLSLWASTLPILPYCAVPGLRWNDRFFLAPVTFSEAVGSILEPYLPPSAVEADLHCVAIPDGNDANMIVSAQVVGLSGNAPVQARICIARVKGPVSWEVVFPDGRFRAELVTFEPSATGAEPMPEEANPIEEADQAQSRRTGT